MTWHCACIIHFLNNELVYGIILMKDYLMKTAPFILFLQLFIPSGNCYDINTIKFVNPL